VGVQRELEAGIHGGRSLPKNQVGPVHNFQDILTAELDRYVPGTAYLRRRVDANKQQKITQCKLIEVLFFQITINKI
jgi:hypothetical protein